MGRIKAFIFPFFIFVTIIACSDASQFYEKTFPIPESGWALDHTLESNWTPDTSQTEVSVVIDILHDIDFDYQNLYLLGQFNQTGNNLWSDTFSIQLARRNTGIWLGTKHQDMMLRSDTINVPQTFSPDETVRFRLSQFSREAILQGVNEVTVRIVRPETK